MLGLVSVSQTHSTTSGSIILLLFATVSTCHFNLFFFFFFFLIISLNNNTRERKSVCLVNISYFLNLFVLFAISLGCTDCFKLFSTSATPHLAA